MAGLWPSVFSSPSGMKEHLNAAHAGNRKGQTANLPRSPHPNISNRSDACRAIETAD